MTAELAQIVSQSPEVLVFLSLALGYLVGKLKFKGFSLGATASVLLIAMVLGQFSSGVPTILKDIAFSLFAFCIGYQVGPQFFGSLKKEGLNYLLLALFVALIGLGTAVLLGKAMYYDKGTTAGLFAGAMTQSAVIGTATGAVEHLPISEGEKQKLDNNIAVSYAITYLFGTVGVILLFKLLPGFMGINLKKEAKTLEEKMGASSGPGSDPDLFSWSKIAGLRAYLVENKDLAGRTVAEAQFPQRAEIDKIKRGAALMDALPDTRIEASDILLVAGGRAALCGVGALIGKEVDTSSVAEIVGEILEVCVLDPKVIGRTLGEIANEPFVRGVFLVRMTRQGMELPITRDTVINNSDVVQIVGTKEAVDRAAEKIGYPMRHTPVTDLVMVGAGCVIGTLIGSFVLPVAGIPITLGVGGGVLVAGLFAGWLRSKHPTFGQMPDAAQWLLSDLGLTLFVACIGLTSGKQALAAIAANGLSVFLSGIVLAIVPILLGVVFGRYILKMNPVLLLGGLMGSRVIPPALAALQEDAQSKVMSLGFAAPFAFANVFLTVMGSVIINLM